MQNTSPEYKASMASSLRERGYIMISFGVMNSEAQANASVSAGDFNYYSNESNIFGETQNIKPYATLEEDYTKVDGKMLFPPRYTSGGAYLATGLVSENLVSDGTFEMTISLNMPAIDFKGITINFGDNYPTSFDLVGSTGQTYEYRNNTQAIFTTEDVLNDTTSVKLVVYSMLHPNNRLRIYSIRFGYGLVYYNNDVVNSTMDSYVSPICADIPQIDFSVQLTNYDHYFEVDNPNSAINFLETGQAMDVWYGYELPDTHKIEWFLGNHLLCSDWEADDYTATIRCQDVFRNLSSEYYKGVYNSAGVTYYALAEAVLADANITDYYIDSQLREMTTKNPLPRVTHKEALQIIANACRCVLSQTRSGMIQIKSAYMPTFSITTPAEADYSTVENVLCTTPIAEYASFATNYTRVDGSMFFIPRDLTGNLLHTGFVSAVQSDANCEFGLDQPELVITLDVARLFYGMRIVFGNALPDVIGIATYKDGEYVDTFTITSADIRQDMMIHEQFNEFNRMELFFPQSAEPYNRIVVNAIEMGDITNFRMTRDDMTSSPKVTKQERVKEVVVPCYVYHLGTSEENILTDDVVVTSGDTITFYMTEPSYNYRAELQNVVNGVTVQESGAYYVTLLFNATGTFNMSLYGYKYTIVERYSTNTLNTNGTTVKWDNPLISSMDMADDLATWLGDYYDEGVEYEYNTRGNPELDTGDIIYQDNSFNDNMRVKVYRQTLNFNGSFSGRLTTRRLGGNA